MYNSEIQSAMRNRKGIGEMLGASPFDEILEDIDAKLEAEKPSEPEGADPAGEKGGDPMAETWDAAFTDNPELKKMEEKMDEEQVSKLEKFKCMARNLVNSHVDLIPETLPNEEIVRQIQDSAACKVEHTPDHRTFTAIVYDPRCCGVSSSNPTLRVPGLRTNGEHLKTLAKLVFRARGDEIKDNDMWLLFDAGRAGCAGHSN
eukprot:1403620-Pyramimonas_sp.AAC.1